MRFVLIVLLVLFAAGCGKEEAKQDRADRLMEESKLLRNSSLEGGHESHRQGKKSIEKEREAARLNEEIHREKVRKAMED
jgi:hypothetical protein